MRSHGKQQHKLFFSLNNAVKQNESWKRSQVIRTITNKKTICFFEGRLLLMEKIRLPSWYGKYLQDCMYMFYTSQMVSRISSISSMFVISSTSCWHSTRFSDIFSARKFIDIQVESGNPSVVPLSNWCRFNNQNRNETECFNDNFLRSQDLNRELW